MVLKGKTHYNWGLPRLSIVIPAYNEEQRLPGTLETVLRWIDQPDYRDTEVLVVDDGSRDGTAAVGEAFGKRDTRVRVLRNPGNKGKGYSVRHGMMEGKGDWLLFSDADLSAPIDELPKLTEAVRRDKAEVAIGSRAMDRSLIGVHQSGIREEAGKFFNLLMKVSVGLPFQDTQCGFKLFSKRAASEIFRRQTIERFGFDAEVLFIARLHGLKTVEVPVRWNHAEGTKIAMWSDGADMFLDLVRIRRNQWQGKYR